MAKRERVESGPVARWIAHDAAGCANPPPVWAVELLQSAEPISVPITLKQRMLLSLGHGRPRSAHRWLRPIVVCAILVSGTAVASAALTGWPADLVRVCREMVAGPPPARSAARAVEGRATRLAPASADESIPSMMRRPSADSRRRAKLRVVPGEDPALMVEATRALRVDGDARRARLLAAQYLQQHPRGALAEEALAIEVEAALDHHDADVTAEAARYLSQYPRGAFRALAEHALSAR